MDDATTRDMVENVIHESAYARHRQDLVIAMERDLRIAADNKVAQVEMEEAYVVAIELMKNKADHSLKTWMESDLIRVEEIQELQEMLPEEYQPAIRKEYSPLIPIVHRQEDCPLKSLSPSVDTEEKPWTNTANDGIFPEDYARENQMWQPWKEPRCSEV